MVGHVLWLAGISFAISTTDISTWVLVVAAVSFVVGAGATLLGRRLWQRKDEKSEARAAFLWGLTISPVLLSLIVLGVTYL